MRCPSSESMVQLLLKSGRRESIPTPRPAPLRKAGLLMRRTILLLTTVSLALLLVGGVAASQQRQEQPTSSGGDVSIQSSTTAQAFSTRPTTRFHMRILHPLGPGTGKEMAT